MLVGKSISKAFAEAQILKDVQFNVPKNEVLSILGRSGSGKTTLLKIIAGLETLDSGTVEMEGESILDLVPAERNIVYLYQEALLFPHLSVFDNIAFGLSIRKVGTHEIEERVTRLLNALELRDHRDKMPQQISGGQRQRVAFGRALIINPRVLLLDEPFGALDVETRHQMQQLFKKIATEYAITALFVTHDLKEALIMGDQIGLMENGKLLTYASKNAFIQDQKTGVQDEIKFWQQLGSGF